MKEIVDRLHENRQIELAKSILEANGYKVEKTENLKESFNPDLNSEYAYTGVAYLNAMDTPENKDYLNAIYHAKQILDCELEDMVVINHNEPCGLDFSEIAKYPTIRDYDEIRNQETGFVFAHVLKKDPATQTLIVWEEAMFASTGYGEPDYNIYFCFEKTED